MLMKNNMVALTKGWAESVLRRMGFRKRRANPTSKVLPCDFDTIKQQFPLDIKSVVMMEDIPEQLIINGNRQL